MIFVCAMTMAQTNAYPLLPMPQNYKVTDKSFAMGKVKLSKIGRASCRERV